MATMAMPKSWTGRVLLVVGLVLAAALGAGAIAYAADAGLEADVVSKECRPVGASHVTAVTRLFSVRRTVEVALHECGLVPTGAYVVYHLRSGHTVIWARQGGDCIWDTASGPC